MPKYINSTGLSHLMTLVKDYVDSKVSPSTIDFVYPVGAIYMSVSSTSPATLFGGTWERITGRFLLAATDSGSSGASQAAGNTGGSADAVVPYHRHNVAKVSGGITGGSHSHVIKREQVAGSGSARYAISGSTSGPSTESSTHTHDLPQHYTDYAGTSGNATGANMPPYLAVYVWKRTA